MNDLKNLPSNGKCFKKIFLYDEEFSECLVYPLDDKKSPFPNNSFVRVIEKGTEYLINTDYITFCVI